MTIEALESFEDCCEIPRKDLCDLVESLPVQYQKACNFHNLFMSPFLEQINCLYDSMESFCGNVDCSDLKGDALSAFGETVGFPRVQCNSSCDGGEETIRDDELYCRLLKAHMIGVQGATIENLCCALEVLFGPDAFVISSGNGITYVSTGRELDCFESRYLSLLKRALPKTCGTSIELFDIVDFSTIAGVSCAEGCGDFAITICDGEDVSLLCSPLQCSDYNCECYPYIATSDGKAKINLTNINVCGQTIESISIRPTLQNSNGDVIGYEADIIGSSSIPLCIKIAGLIIEVEPFNGFYNINETVTPSVYLDLSDCIVQSKNREFYINICCKDSIPIINFLDNISGDCPILSTSTIENPSNFNLCVEVLGGGIANVLVNGISVSDILNFASLDGDIIEIEVSHPFNDVSGVVNIYYISGTGNKVLIDDFNYISNCNDGQTPVCPTSVLDISCDDLPYILSGFSRSNSISGGNANYTISPNLDLTSVQITGSSESDESFVITASNANGDCLITVNVEGCESVVTDCDGSLVCSGEVVDSGSPSITWSGTGTVPNSNPAEIIGVCSGDISGVSFDTVINHSTGEITITIVSGSVPASWASIEYNSGFPSFLSASIDMSSVGTVVGTYTVSALSTSLTQSDWEDILSSSFNVTANC